MSKFYFTFGLGTEHAHEFVCIEDETYNGAREKMFEHFGPHWAFQYTEEEWKVCPKDDPNFRLKAVWNGIDPDTEEPITIDRLYNLTEIKL